MIRAITAVPAKRMFVILLGIAILALSFFAAQAMLNSEPELDFTTRSAGSVLVEEAASHGESFTPTRREWHPEEIDASSFNPSATEGKKPLATEDDGYLSLGRYLNNTQDDERSGHGTGGVSLYHIFLQRLTLLETGEELADVFGRADRSNDCKAAVLSGPQQC